MNTLTVNQYTLHISNGSINSDSTQFEFIYESGQIQTLYVVNTTTRDQFELMTCKQKSGSLYMNHLEVPEKYRGNDLGKLGVAFFYYLLDTNEYSNYSIKFGGGEKSASFLHNLGFSSNSIEVGQDIDSSKSVMVGEYISQQHQSHNQSVYDWTLRPIDKRTFPTDFFTIKYE